MSYEPNYIGYELGYYLCPAYKGYVDCNIFYILLQNPKPDKNAEMFSVKLGKTRTLDKMFYSDCKKVLIYLTIDGGTFTVYDIELSRKKDGTLFFDAVSFLEQLNIEYEMQNTSYYRYLKARLQENRLELILQEDYSEISIIHRRISSDDREFLRVYKNNKINNTLKKGYFFIEYASDRLMNYHNVEYFKSENEVLEYIRNEYSGTDGEIITTYSVEELMRGQCYQQKSRMGCHESDMHIVLVHDKNLPILFRFIDSTRQEDGERIVLSGHLKMAKTEEEVKKVIEIYNSLQVYG